VLDPACGPGGFLIHSLAWVFERYLKPRFKSGLAKRKFEYANSRLFGIDFDRRLSRVAKAMMLIAGDGRSNVYCVNSLDAREWSGRTGGLVAAIQDGTFDMVMTNPPFAGNVRQPEILSCYDLAYKGDPGKHKGVTSLTRDVLFIERSLRFLKAGGRMAIVLPQGNLNNSNAEYIRSWVIDNARILAVVGLHVNTFKPFTGTKTSVLFVRKWGSGERPQQDYPIFLAVNQKPVKDNSGDYIFKKTPDGSHATDAQGRRMIDHDLDEVAEGFIEFAQHEGFDFWKA
jgi:type I restriction enzyme M protein